MITKSISPSLYGPSELTARLTNLAHGLGFKEQSAKMISIFKELTNPYFNISLAQIKNQNSVFANDGSPLEFSVAVCDDKPELRFSMEVIEGDSSISGKRLSAILFTEKLKKLYHLDLEKFNLIKDIFLPEKIQGKFAMFHSVCFSLDGPPSFKLYLNARAAERDALSAIQLGLERLGYQSNDVLKEILKRGEPLDQVVYFSLDIDTRSDSRVKVYCYHKNATLQDITRISKTAKTFVADEQENFVQHMTGGMEIFSKWNLISCTAFTEQDESAPQTITTYVPMFAYAHDDDEAYHRIIKYLTNQNLSPTLYRNMIDCYKNRELSAGVGMQNWISLQRRSDNKMRWTVYLAAELLKVFRPGEIPSVLIHSNN